MTDISTFTITSVSSLRLERHRWRDASPTKTQYCLPGVFCTVRIIWGCSFDLNCQRGLLSLFSLCSEVRITPHHENGLLHLHLVWCSILSSETAETLAAARVSGVASFSATLVGPSDWIRTSGLLNPIQARYQTSPHPEIAV